MTSVAAGEVELERESESAAVLDRALAALPLVLVFVWLALLHAWQAWAVPSPWLFSDELEHTQLARSLAETGETARRGVPFPASSLYVWLTAPAWLISNVETAYHTAKFLGAVVMTAAVFPAYGLARLVAGPWSSLFAAAAAGAIPAFMYSGLLLQEPLAYPFATLCLYVFARALAYPTFRWVLLAVLLAVIASRVRPQLAILPAVLVFAGTIVAAGSVHGRRLRARLSTWDRVGVGLLALGAVIAANEYASHRSVPWQQATRYWKDRMVDLGLDAAGALTIGLGILPVIAGLALLGAALRRRDDRPLVALAAVSASAIAAFGFYTALKAAYLSTVFSTLITERNLIYLAPLFFAGTAYWLSRGPLPVPDVLLAAAFVGLLLVTTPYELGYPYFEAPGFSILALANRELAWDEATIQRALLLVLAVSVLLLLVLPSRLLRDRPRVLATVGTFAALLVLGWNVTGEATASAGSRSQGEFLLSGYTTPVDWIDRSTGREPAVYLGQQIEDPNQVHLLEFWNRSIQSMWSLDATARGPGPTLTPDLRAVTGELHPDPQFDYVVAEGGIELVGTVVAGRPGLQVYRIEHPLRLQHAVTGLFKDGWSLPQTAYSRYETPGGRPGTMVVSIARRGCANPNVRATARVAVGPLVVGPDIQPMLATATARESVLLRCGDELEVALASPSPPFRVEVTIDPPFVPAEVDPRATDRRALGAQIGYRFVPDD